MVESATYVQGVVVPGVLWRPRFALAAAEVAAAAQAAAAVTTSGDSAKDEEGLQEEKNAEIKRAVNVSKSNEA